MSKPLEHAQKFLTACGVEFTPLSQRERWEFQQRWREVYAARLHAKTGRWTLGDFDWHIFSSNEASYVDGPDTLAQFRQLGNSSYCLFSDLMRPYFSRANWQADFLPGKISTAQLDKLPRIHHRRHGKQK